MKKLLKVLGVLVIVVVALGAGGYLYVQSTWDRDYSSVPLPAITASKDSAVIARGEYLVRTVAHCAECHALASDRAAGIGGPLTGGFVFDIPLFGRFVPANLTSDPETGLGNVSDGQIARAVRNGVGRSGRLVPFMMFSVGSMSDEDLTAVISYLRTQPAVKKAVAAEEWGLFAKALSGNFKPRNDPPMTHVAPGGVSVERGEYLVRGPAGCKMCHTPTDPMTFQFSGPEMSGNTMAEPDGEEAGYEFVIPNLTPDSATGHIISWTEDQFVARFRQGRVFQGSKMPWEAFVNLTEEDLRSVYRYLRSIPAVHNLVGPTHRKAGEKPAEKR